MSISICKKRIVDLNYHLENHVLECVTEFKDLGVIYDHKFSFDNHIQYIRKKASRTLSFIIRFSSEFKSVYTFIHLYITLVRPIVEYASQIWRPHSKQSLVVIERIQHRFLRIGKPMGRFEHDYSESVCSELNKPIPQLT